MQNLKQPKALYLIFSVQMWECFSYFGMLSLLVIFMIKKLGFTDAKAFGIVAIYTAFLKAGGVIGGYIGDRILGSRNTIYLASLVIMAGHLLLAIPDSIISFYLALSFIIIGTGLFRPNCVSLLSEFYSKDDKRAEAGFNYYYIAINFGGFFASILCGYVGENYGWNYGFSIAAIGMALAILTLYKFTYILEGKGVKENVSSLKFVTIIIAILLAVPIIGVAMHFYEYSQIGLFGIYGISFYLIYEKAIHLNKAEKKNLLYLFGLMLFLVAFYAIDIQYEISLVMFVDRFAHREIFGLTIPTTSFIALNPLSIIIFGSLITRYMEKNPDSYLSSNPLNKIALAFLCCAISFYGFFLVAKYPLDNMLNFSLIVLGFVLVATSEIFIGPLLYAACAKLAPSSLKAELMGVIVMCYSLAYLLGGKLSHLVAVETTMSETQMRQIYQNGYFMISMLALGVVILIKLLQKSTLNIMINTQSTRSVAEYES